MEFPFHMRPFRICIGKKETGKDWKAVQSKLKFLQRFTKNLTNLSMMEFYVLLQQKIVFYHYVNIETLNSHLKAIDLSKVVFCLWPTLPPTPGRIRKKSPFFAEPNQFVLLWSDWYTFFRIIIYIFLRAWKSNIFQ